MAWFSSLLPFNTQSVEPKHDSVLTSESSTTKGVSRFGRTRATHWRGPFSLGKIQQQTEQEADAIRDSIKGKIFWQGLGVLPISTFSESVCVWQPWPEDALQLVANRYLDDVEMSQHVREQTVLMCRHFHQSVRSLSER